jgi:hypothetical protein
MRCKGQCDDEWMLTIAGGCMRYGLQLTVVYNETWCFGVQSASITPTGKVNR